MSQTSGEEPQVSSQSEGLVSLIKQTTPREKAVLICSFGLFLAFFAPWIKSDIYLSGLTFYKIAKSTRIAWIIPLFTLATAFKYHDKKVCARLGTVTAVITWIIVGYCVAQAKMQAFDFPAWGQRLTILFALGIFAFCAERKIAAPIDYVAKKLSSRKAAVFGHWLTPTADCHFSTKEFYDEIETAIRAKQWPGVQLLRIDHFEAGMLSHKREYLRVVRHRQLFDICAATFGKDYFFSVREAEIPAVVNIRACLTILLSLLFLLGFCVDKLGLFFGSIVMVSVLAFTCWFLFNIVKLGLSKVDSILIQLPSIGPVYEAVFRRDTYFQQDTRLFFLQCVNDLVKSHVEKTTSAKGLMFLNRFENQPILGELYKRSRVEFGNTPEIA